MKKYHLLALMCAALLLTACNNQSEESTPTSTSEATQTTESVGGEEVETIPTEPTITIGKNDLDSVELEEEMGGSFRLTKNSSQVSIDFELNFGNITGYKNTNVYVTVEGDKDINTVVAEEPMLSGVTTLLTQGLGVYYAQIDTPALDGFDPSKSQTDNYNSICAAYGITYVGEEDLESIAPTVSDYIAIDSSNMVLNVGDTAQVNLLHIPEGYSAEDIIYFTTDTAIASVDEHGVVTGRKMGAVTLKAQTADGMHSAQTVVVVNDDSVTVLEPDDPE